MTDLRPTIVPKSDQLNADDLIGRSLTVKITKVALCGEADQPIAVHYEGDGGKPYKPCKSMRRVMVKVWGEDGNAFVGRSMTLYRDDAVQWGGLAVGGIRISHMSDIDRDITMALTATRANRKPFTVKPLRIDQSQSSTRAAPSANNGGAEGGETRTQTGSAMTLVQRAEAFKGRVSAAMTKTKLDGIWAASEGLRAELDNAEPELLVEIVEFFGKRSDVVAEMEREPAA